MMVAHAAKLSNWDFQIYSKKQKSKLFGAQYLHEPIPDMTEGEGVMLDYSLRGTPEEYRQKVYGEAWDGNTSPEDYPEPHRAWDLRDTYEKLWFDYGHEVTAIEIGTYGPQSQMWYNKAVLDSHDLVISTVPRTVWDSNESHFQKTYVWAQGGFELGDLKQDNNTVICDGTNLTNWYRSAMIFGQGTLEWPQWWNARYASVTPPAPGAVRVAKPLVYTGSAAREFIHLGRYAQWEKGVLTSDVFEAAMKVFANDSI